MAIGYWPLAIGTKWLLAIGDWRLVHAGRVVWLLGEEQEGSDHDDRGGEDAGSAVRLPEEPPPGQGTEYH
jgi:hypothetical protein